MEQRKLQKQGSLILTPMGGGSQIQRKNSILNIIPINTLSNKNPSPSQGRRSNLSDDNSPTKKPNIINLDEMLEEVANLDL